MDIRKPTNKRKTSWWKKEFALPVAQKNYAGLLEAFVKDVETQSPASAALIQAAREVSGSVRNREYSRAIDLAEQVASQQYGTAEESFFAAQLAALVVKMPFTGPDFTPEKEAWIKFLASEERCAETNSRLKLPNPYELYFNIARGWIERVIGEQPDLARVSECCGFGPGASVGVHGNSTNAGRKLSSEAWTVTPVCSEYARAFMAGDAHIWELLLPYHQPHSRALKFFKRAFGERVQYIDYNKVSLVPKKAKIHRTIAIEPLLNGYVQKGFELELRRCLARFGFDLTDQSFNQRLALLGSKGGFDPIVTIDLTDASGSMATELCRCQLPPAWYGHLNNVRSPCYLTEAGEVKRYEKFVSMGNGFCFPLETLIFASFCYAVYSVHKPRTGVYSVYGDDIAVHQSVALILLDILRYAGFEPNDRKTFISGPFRESCGADYFEGVNIRPYYLDEWGTSYPKLFKILNGIRGVPYTFLQYVWDYLYGLIPADAKLLRPFAGPPDTAITVPLDLFLAGPSGRWNRKLQCWDWKEFLFTPVEDGGDFPEPALMYGVVRSIRSSKRGKPAYALRRETRTSVRWLLD